MHGGERHHLVAQKVCIINSNQRHTLVLYWTLPSASRTRENSWSAFAPASSKVIFSLFLNKRTCLSQVQIYGFRWIPTLSGWVSSSPPMTMRPFSLTSPVKGIFMRSSSSASLSTHSVLSSRRSHGLNTSRPEFST